MIASISAFAGVLFSVPAGILADRLGKRRLLLGAGIIFAALPFAYLLVRSISQLAPVRLCHGFITAIFVPVAMAAVSSLSREQRGERLGWFSTATLAGRFLAPLAGGATLGLFGLSSITGYRAVYLLCGAMGLVALFMAVRPPGLEEKKPDRTWAAAWQACKPSSLIAAFSEPVSWRPPFFSLMGPLKPSFPCMPSATA